MEKINFVTDDNEEVEDFLAIPWFHLQNLEVKKIFAKTLKWFVKKSETIL